MSKLVSNVSSQTSPGITVSDNPVFLIATRGFEGKQIFVEWNVNALSATRILLIRKKFSYPKSITDGVVLLDESPVSSSFYNDLSVDDLTTFYYKLFYQDTISDWREDTRLKDNEFTCTTIFFKRKLWELLPLVYRSEDEKSPKSFLKNEFISDIKQYLHLNLEDSERTVGQLRRFLYLFAIFLDEIKCLIDFMPTLWDVDNTPAEFLQHLATIVGVDLNFDIPIDRQRIEIKEAVNTYKIKGTLQGIESHAQKITGLDADVDEIVNTILVSNKEDRLSLDFDDISDQLLMGNCGDPFHYSLDFSSDATYAFYKILICLSIVEGKELLERVVKKLSRTIYNWIPADSDAVISYEDLSDVQFYTPANSIEESSEDTTETRSFLISMSITLVSNDVDILSQEIN